MTMKRFLKTLLPDLVVRTFAAPIVGMGVAAAVTFTVPAREVPQRVKLSFNLSISHEHSFTKVFEYFFNVYVEVFKRIMNFRIPHRRNSSNVRRLSGLGNSISWCNG